MVDAEGNLIWVESRGKAVFNSEGRIIKLYGTFQNISQSKLMELETLKAQNLSLMYQNMMDDFAIVAKTDKNGTINYVNDKFCEISKFGRDELVGKNHHILNSGYHSQEFFKNMWNTILAGKTWRSEVCNRAKDGELYWVDTFIAPLFDHNHSIDGFMAIRFDITDKKNLAESLADEREKATIASKMVSMEEMSAGIAHEINNPLAIITGNVDLLRSHIAKEKYDSLPKKLDKISKSVERITKIIKGLKRLSYKANTADLEKVSMKEIMDDTLEFSREMLKSKGIELIVEELPEAEILCHSVEISQVILNLINNARDAIINFEEKWIKIQTFQMHDKLRINVIDSGPGIPPEIKDKIMDSFFTTKEFGKGTGLGLSLSKRIVEEYNGELFISDEHNHTCFSVILPVIKE